MAVLDGLFDLPRGSGAHYFLYALLDVSIAFAICVVYRKSIRDILALLRRPYPERSEERRKRVEVQRFRSARLAFMAAIAALPTLIVLFFDTQTRYLLSGGIYAGFILILTGGALFAVREMTGGRVTEKNMRISDAIVVGIAQSLALFSGLSRSGMALGAGAAVGLSPAYALQFSFLSALPYTILSAVVNIVRSFSEGLIFAEVPFYILAMVLASVCGVVAMGILKLVTERGGYAALGYYSCGAGLLTIVLTLVF